MPELLPRKSAIIIISGGHKYIWAAVVRAHTALRERGNRALVIVL